MSRSFVATSGMETAYASNVTAAAVVRTFARSPARFETVEGHARGRRASLPASASLFRDRSHMTSAPPSLVTVTLTHRVTTKMDFHYSIEYRYSWYQEYLIFYLILIVSRIVHL